MRDSINLKKEACRLAQEVLDNEKEYLDNVQKMWGLGEKLLGSVWDTEFHIFGVIASDTDHLPLNKVRKYCSTEMLRKSDEELKTIILHNKNEVTRACNEILAKHKDM